MEVAAAIAIGEAVLLSGVLSYVVALRNQKPAPPPPLPLSVAPAQKSLPESQFRQWCVDGYALAETSSVRSQKENETKPTSYDKRECAIAWVKSQCEAAGVEWSPSLAARAVQLIEIHHAQSNPDAVFKLVRK